MPLAPTAAGNQPSTGALAGWGTGRRPTTGQGLDLPSSSMDPLLKVLNCCRRGALLVASVVMAPDLEEDFQVVLQAARSRMRVDDLSSELHWRSRLPVDIAAGGLHSTALTIEGEDLLLFWSLSVMLGGEESTGGLDWR
ncbi:uncharacterized protein [Miscanthus floridulus]|uniref:uncharacterized protein isoform X3 n=1 Tax=Miscanthus floridulus TaxID=154761 RepID=UPI003457CB3A